MNDAAVRLRKPRARAANVLLLLPHCLQKDACERNIAYSVDHCARCGRCNIAELLALRDELGVQCRLVSGGREAAATTREAGVRVIVAVACARELAGGILAALPKPVVAVRNECPAGPCRSTRVDVAAVRAALLGVIENHV